jgi:GGDEF domain-containing protein
MLGREHALGHPALTDSDTGLANRLHFELVYSYLFHGADRGVPLTLLVLSTASPNLETIRAIGVRLQDSTRAADLVAHLGGGRFAMLLLGSNLQGGRVAADRVDRALEGVSPTPLCIGVAAYTREMKDPTDLLEAADNALRKAEGAGGGVELTG